MRSVTFALLAVSLGFLASHVAGTRLPYRRLLAEGTKFNYQQSGSDWADQFPDCAGDLQSPINIDTEAAYTAYKDLSARLTSFGTGDQIKVQNTGQAVLVTWNEIITHRLLLPVVGGEVTASIDPIGQDPDDAFQIPANGTFQRFSFADAQLKQFHFHISSENSIDGVIFPMEAHIVTNVPKEEVPACGDAGCTVVFGILYETSEEDNEILEPIFSAAPDHAGPEYVAELPKNFTLDLDDMIPDTKSYYTWKGSFTTPPCTEGVLWILFDKPSFVSSRQVNMLQNKMALVRNTCQKEAEEEGSLEKFKECNFIGDLKNNREVQRLNGRHVTHVVGSKERR